MNVAGSSLEPYNMCHMKSMKPGSDILDFRFALTNLRSSENVQVPYWIAYLLSCIQKVFHFPILYVYGNE